MFQKQTFGAANTGFGSFNAGASTSSPFSGFKPTAGTSAFGAPPAFGANATPQPAAGGGLFGATNPSSSLFGGNTTTSSFGTTSGFGFGPSTSTGGGLFSNTTSGVGGGLFGNNQNNAGFGAKPAGFGFSNTTNTNTTGLFGSAPSTSTGLFGQQNTTMGGGGLFGNTSGGFGQQQATGTAHVKYNPMVGTDVVVKSGTSQNVNIKHHCITCMKEYEGKSLEELRLEDYVAGRKGATGGGVFGGFQQTENKPLFGGPSFGQPATTSAPSLFGTGIGSTPAFGQTNTFSFGNAAQTNTNTTGLFGANKPAFGAPSTGTGLFGATTTQAPAFGTNTSTFGFGNTTQNQTTGGLFGAKPATTGFGAPAASTGFGAFGSGGLFGAKPQQTTAPTFGSTAPTFGTTPGFGTNTTGSSLFGGSTFGKPPTTQATFAFNTQPTLGTGLGGGLGTAFQAKPTTPAFGSLGGMGTGSMFQAPAQNNTFRTGLDSGLGGGGLFGNTSSLGGNTLGLGQLNANNTSLGSGLSGASAAGNVHEQILSLAARPYGDQPLFKDLLPDNSRAEDALRATNPACVKAALQGAHFRVASPPSRLALAPRPVAHDRKSLFDGLEESDASLEDKLSLKPSRKRLVLRPNTRTDDDVARHENNGSIEDTSRQDVNNQETRENQDPKDYISQRAEREMMKQRHVDNNNVDSNSDRHGSWLDSSQTWSEKGKRIESGESSPRLYPNLDKELPAQVPERRASWLTTKPLRKPLVSNPESAENSVRELGVRSDRSAEDKENIDTLSVSEEENVPTREMPPHPAGVKLTRPGYYTIPSLEEITKYMRPDGSCIVPHLTIGRQNYGNVYFDCEIDVAGMDLDALVHFLNKEVIIYPDDEHKPPVGEGLNRRAVITLERVWPRDKTEKRPVTEPDRLQKMDYEGKLRRVCDKHDTKFIEYRPQTGSWVFRVEHFSKYGLTDSDEDDWSESVVARMAVGRTHSNSTQDVLCRQLASLLQFSSFAEAAPDACPRLDVQREPAQRRRLLRRLLRDAADAAAAAAAAPAPHGGAAYGMSNEYCLQVWKLCEALWGDDLDNDGVPGMDEKSIVNRHKRLLDWLKESVSDITDKELAETTPGEPEDESDGHSARVWALLAGGRLREACALSRQHGDLALAALLAQHDDPAFKSLVARQLRVWQQCGAESLVAGSRLATLHVLAGLRPERHLQRLDWLRAFAVTARYLCPQIPTLEQVVRTYEGYFSSEPEADLHTLPDDEMGMQFPLPPYLDQYSVTTASGGRRRVLDVRYELLRARALNAPPALAPATCSRDPFDFSLSFPLASWLGVGSSCVVGAAEQLEASGNWHLALQVLAYHRDDNARSHLIRQVLSRHAPSQVETPEMKERFDLIKKLKIPEKWVLIAQANRAKYEHKPALEVEYLVGAEQWNAAHRVLLKELLPDAVLADNLQSIKGILEKMNDAADRHEVSGWETGGQALYHYLRVCDEIRGLVRCAGAAGGAVCARLEALRPALAAACRSLRGLTPRSPRHAAARAEMGARLVQLALAGGEPPPHLAALLAQLRLPPDCAARAAHRITTDMAERASELCVESAPSPESSQRATAVET
ncbi:nuclear pore complex protein Nup98-Nup96 [Vanessa atalanta]|uniref:nuclear pore complex protein Nup98-Nup96 n=1 Tax=Vanessa atalanta TaxID=42275 RepID=UPI001FCCEF01|nr:nuclear pore complex protein Nup98-Nup96 [Vanessa atalanta]